MTETIKWRVKHAPAKTVYTIQCHDLLTLTVGYGEPVPSRYDIYNEGKRTDIPEHWELWGHLDNISWVQSQHDTREDAREALRANRKSPPPSPLNNIDRTSARWGRLGRHERVASVRRPGNASH